MAAEAGGDGGDERATDRAPDDTWSIDWDEIPMARLVDGVPAKPPPREQRKRPLTSPAPAAPDAAAPAARDPQPAAPPEPDAEALPAPPEPDAEAIPAPPAPEQQGAPRSPEAQPAQPPSVLGAPAPPPVPKVREEAAAPPPERASVPPPPPARDARPPSVRERLRPFLEDAAAALPPPGARQRLRPPLPPSELAPAGREQQQAPDPPQAPEPPREPDSAPRPHEPEPEPEASRSVGGPPTTPPVDDIAAPLPPLPPLPASASPAPPEPRERRWRKRSRKPETLPVVPQATGGRRRSRSHRRGSRRVPLRLIAILGLTGALGAGGVYLLTRKDAGTPTSSRERPAAVRGSSSGPAEPAAPRPVDNRRLYPKDEAFVASGVRFTVVPDPTAPWAREIAATDPGAGQRWQLVSVLYRNVSRQRLLAEELRFRMKDGANNVFPPVPGKGNGGSNLAPQTPIAVGTLVKAQLTFLVPADAGELSLIIDPGPKTRARVQLGPG